MTGVQTCALPIWAGETRYVCEESAELFAKEVMPRFADDVPVKKPAIEPAE